MRAVGCLLLPSFAVAGFAQQFVFPVDSYEVTGYQFAQQVVGLGRHLGEDAHATIGVGTPVRAIADGTIILSETKRQGYGQYVVISHSSPFPFVSVYGHLSRQPQYPLRGVGTVKQNDIIGYIGSQDENGGWSPHLHFAIYKKPPDGTYHYWGYAPNATGDDVDVDPQGNFVGGLFTKPSDFLSPPNTGTETTQATLNGQPWSGPVSYDITGPNGVIIGQSVPGTTANLQPGSYTMVYLSGGPLGSTFAGVSPSATQTLTAGGTITFTLQFASVNQSPTARFTMISGNQSATEGQNLSLVVLTGGTANVNFSANRSSDPDGTVAGWEWRINRTLVSTASSFTFGLGKGNHVINLVVTDNRGAKSPAAQGGVVVTESADETWSQKLPSNVPCARNSHTLTYDAGRQQLILFGGYNQCVGSANDTWVWDGNNWTQKFPPGSPAPRFGHAMAYDALHHQVVLFGGTNIQEFNDTWVWDGNNWTQRFPLASPPARYNCSMAYDASLGQVVLFGGINPTNSGALGDTWVWDGTNWTQKFPSSSPGARYDYVLTFDGTGILLFGGNGYFGPLFADTWVWDGTNWNQRFPATQPSARLASSAAYNANLHQVVLFGGFTPGAPSFDDDTWIWDGTTWTLQNPNTQPPARAIHSMAYDSFHQQIVLFGGSMTPETTYVFFNDTWVWPQP